METFVINGVSRDKTGTSNAKKERTEGWVPCIVYGGGDNKTFNVKPLEVRDLVYNPDFKVVEVVLDGETHRCILKDLQFHPLTDQLMHMDFLRLAEGQTVKLDVPVKCVGVSPGVKLGGKLQQKMRTLKIKTTPECIIDHLTVDISALQLGDSVRVRDVKAPEGVVITNPMANPIATVDTPRAMRSAKSASEKTK